MHSTSHNKFWAVVINIITVFSRQSLVGTPNFICVACLVWPENNFLIFAIYHENTSSNKCHLYISDDCTPTTDHLKLKLYRTWFEWYLKQLVKFPQNQRWWNGDHWSSWRGMTQKRCVEFRWLGYILVYRSPIAIKLHLPLSFDHIMVGTHRRSVRTSLRFLSESGRLCTCA